MRIDYIDEIWLDIPDYEGSYKISNYGNVFSFRSNKYLKPINQNEILQITLYKDPKVANKFLVHRLVAKLFIPNNNLHLNVRHIDGNTFNNKFDNLEWYGNTENSNPFIDEVWKDLTDFEGIYKVSNYGRILRIKTNSVLKSSLSSCKKYYRIELCKDGKKYRRLIHRLLCIHFLPNPNNYQEINHIDHNSLNNNLNNLEWINDMGNTAHGKLNLLTTSKYLGVNWKKQSNKWVARLTVNGKRINLGCFTNEEDAFKARCNAEKLYNIDNKYLYHKKTINN